MLLTKGIGSAKSGLSRRCQEHLQVPGPQATRQQHPYLLWLWPSSWQHDTWGFSAHFCFLWIFRSSHLYLYPPIASP